MATVGKKKTSSPRRKKKLVMVSGGFDPIHIGHVRMFEDAKKLGDKLVVVINNDHWIKLKKGHVFMSAEDRAELIGAIKHVDAVVISNHTEHTTDMSVCEELLQIHPDVFANGGDRFADNIPEFKACRELGIEMVFNVGKGGKIRSSSELLNNYKGKKKS